MKKWAKLGVVSFIFLIATGSLLLLTKKNNLPKSNSQPKESQTNLIFSPRSYFITDPISENIRILFGGDMMFDRQIRQVAQNKGYDFILQEMTPFFSDKDLVAANLEGPITSFDSISLGTEIGSKNNYVFTFDPKVAETLFQNNIRLINLGNNHSLNFGQEGLNQTKKILSENKIDFFGHTGPDDRQNRVKIMEVKGKKIAFVNYNQFAVKGLEVTLTDLDQIKTQPDLIFVYAHWGSEYQSQTSAAIKKIAYQLVDAGADLIIGSHPHVVQEKEVYREKTIYYSLGNFVFDQYFSKETQKGLLLEVTINPDNDELEFLEHPIALLPNGQTTLE